MREQKHMQRLNVGLKIVMDGVCGAKPATRQITNIELYNAYNVSYNC